MVKVDNRRQLIKKFNEAPAEVRGYLESLPYLLNENYPLDVALAYVFYRVELAHNMAIYCGVTKVHKAEGTIAGSAIDAKHMTRESFLEMFEIVFGRELPTATRNLLKDAEKIRDRVMHGKRTSDPEKREAIVKVIKYAEKFNEAAYEAAKFRPFGNLRGFRGCGKSLPKATTRWVLKGMGFPVK